MKTPQRHWLVGPHVDYQINDSNTLSLRYLFTRAAINDAGIGSFDQISRGYHQLITFNTAQAIENSVHGNTVNETRFQFFRSGLDSEANSIAQEIQVLGSFNGGGASAPRNIDIQNSYEFQNYTSVLHGAHFWRFGIRMRGQTEDSDATTNFNGTFTFAGGVGPELNPANHVVTDASGNPILVPISSIEQYRRTLLFGVQPSLGAGPSQFTITTGMPDTSVHQLDASPFVGDDWRVRPNLTLSLGLRWEGQTNIRDRRDFAPRVAVAWAPGTVRGKTGKTVIRAGFGIFYDRFALTNTLAAARYNGIAQQQYVVTNPDFYPTIPSFSELAAGLSKPTIQEVDANLRAPEIMQSAFTIERQLPANSTLSVTYTNSDGIHMLRSEDINAPLPGTYNPSVLGSGVLPYPGKGPIFLMASSGLYNQNQLILNVNSKVNPAVSLFGYYVLNKATSDTDGLITFPGNPYDFGRIWSGSNGHPASHSARRHDQPPVEHPSESAD